MIISEKQIMALLQIAENYRACLLHRGDNEEAVNYINTLFLHINEQQSEELKEIN